MEVRLLTQVGAHPVVRIVVQLPESSVLRLQVLRQRVPFHQRGVFPLHLPFEPLLPGLIGVHHWVS